VKHNDFQHFTSFSHKRPFVCKHIRPLEGLFARHTIKKPLEPCSSADHVAEINLILRHLLKNRLKPTVYGLEAVVATRTSHSESEQAAVIAHYQLKTVLLILWLIKM